MFTVKNNAISIPQKVTNLRCHKMLLLEIVLFYLNLTEQTLLLKGNENFDMQCTICFADIVGIWNYG